MNIEDLFLTKEEGKNLENALISFVDLTEEFGNIIKESTSEEMFDVSTVVREAISRKDLQYAKNTKHSLIEQYSMNRNPYEVEVLNLGDINMAHILANIMNSFINEARMEIAQNCHCFWMNYAGITATEKAQIVKLFKNNVCINENIMEVYLNKSKHDIAIIDQSGTKMVIPAAKDAMFNLTTKEFDDGLWGTNETDKLWIIRFQLDNLNHKYPLDEKHEPYYHIYNKFECKIPLAGEEPNYIPEKNLLVFNSEAHMEGYLASFGIDGLEAVKRFIKQKIAQEYFPVEGMYTSMINLSPKQELFTIVLDKCVKIPRVTKEKVEEFLGEEIEDDDKIAVLVEANYKELARGSRHLFYIEKENDGFYSLKSKNLNNNITLGRVDMTSRAFMLEKKYIEPFVLSNGYPVFLSEEECEHFIHHYGKKTGYNVVLNYLSAMGADKAEAVAKLKHNFKWNLRETGKSIAKYLGIVALSSAGTWIIKELIKKGIVSKEPTTQTAIMNLTCGIKSPIPDVTDGKSFLDYLVKLCKALFSKKKDEKKIKEFINNVKSNPMSSPKNIVKVVKVVKKIKKEDKKVKEGIKTMGKLRKTGTALDKARTAVDILKEAEESENKTAALISEVKTARNDLRSILKDTKTYLSDKVTKLLDKVKSSINSFKEWVVSLKILDKLKSVGTKIKNGAIHAWKFTVDKARWVGSNIKAGWFWLLTKVGLRKEIGNGFTLALRLL